MTQKKSSQQKLTLKWARCWIQQRLQSSYHKYVELKEIVQRIKRKYYENYLVNMKSLYFYREIQTALKKTS